jgi:hypothetical protein
MALSRTSVYGAELNTNTQVVTGSFTPPANSLLVVSVFWFSDENSVTGLSPSGGGLTYTQRGPVLRPDNAGMAPAYYAVQEIWTAPVGASPSSMTLTIAPLGAAGTFILADVHVAAYTGYNTGSPVGATGSFTNPYNSTGINDPASLTLSASPASTSYVFASLAAGANNNPGPVTQGVGWTEINFVGNDLNGLGFQSQERTGSTSTTVSWADVDTNNNTNGLWGCSGIAIEITAASGSATTNKTVAATCTSTSTLIKSAAKNLAATCTSTSTLIKSAAKNLAATCTSTSTRILQTGKKLLATCTSTTTGTAIKVILKSLVATCTSTASLAKSVGKPLAATATSTATLLRGVSKTFLATCTSTASLIKSVTKKLLATCTTTLTGTAIKVILKTVAATCTSTASLVRSVGKTLLATCTTTLTGAAATTAHIITLTVVATCTTTASLAKGMSRLLAATCTSTASLLRLVGKPLVATCTSTASTVAHKCLRFTQTVIATCTSTSLVNALKFTAAAVGSLAGKLRPYKPQPAPVIPGSDTLHLLNELQRISNAYNAHVEATKDLDARLKAAGW